MSKDDGMQDKANQMGIDALSHMMEHVTKVKLSGGVVGRIAIILLAGLPSLAIAALASSFGGNPYVCCLVALCIAGSMYQGMKWIMDYAKKNPLTATMEGGELLVHQQLKRQGMKAKPVIKVNRRELTTDPSQPPPHLEGKIEQPDEPQLPEQSPSSGEDKKEVK